MSDAISGVGSYTYGNYGNYQNSVPNFPTSSGSITREEAQKLVDQYTGKNNTSSSNTTSGTKLKNETASFLDRYSVSLKTLSSAANALRGENLDRLLYTNFGKGEMTGETVGKTVDAVQKLVDSYNDTLKLLSDNADRGPGVGNNLHQMMKGPMAKEGMELLGITVNKDGTLSLDKEALAGTLQTAGPEKLAFTKGLIGGVHGLADRVNQMAERANRTSAQNLIQNDLAEIQSVRQQNNPFAEMYSAINGRAYLLNNQAAVGMMMNLFV